MSFEKLVEEKIREAMARGEFDNLPASGRPVDLDSYFATPDHVRLGYSILKAAGIIPEEVELLREIDSLKARLAACPHEAEKTKIHSAINERLLKFDLIMERYRRTRRPQRSF